jgi:hypothetical protein
MDERRLTKDIYETEMDITLKGKDEGADICESRVGELDASTRRSSEMARDWKGLCPTVDCGRLMIMMIISIMF